MDSYAFLSMDTYGFLMIPVDSYGSPWIPMAHVQGSLWKPAGFVRDA